MVRTVEAVIDEHGNVRRVSRAGDRRSCKDSGGSQGAGGPKNILLQSDFFRCRERMSLIVAAEGDGLAQGLHKDLTIRTSAQMFPNFATDGDGQVVIEIGREILQNVQALRLRMAVLVMPGAARRSPRACVRLHAGTSSCLHVLGHV